MVPIIEDLFYNNFEVHTSNPVSPEYKVHSKELDKYYDRVRKEFGDAYFDEFYRAIMDLNNRENLFFFQKGLQLGGQIMMTILGPMPAC